MSFTTEFVLSLVQSYIHDPADFANSQQISKYLYNTGITNPNRKKAPIGFTIEYKRSKKDINRLLKHSDKHFLRNVYTQDELSVLFETITSFPVFDILGINADTDYLEDNSYICTVKQGWYIPVIYKRQNRPFYSMIFSNTNHTKEEETNFLKLLHNSKIYAVYHSGKTNEDSTHIQYLLDNYHNELSEEEIVAFKDFIKPPPFICNYTTHYKRWCDHHSEKQNIIQSRLLLTD